MAVIETPDDMTLAAPAPNAIRFASTERIGRPGSRTYFYWVVANYPIGSSVSQAFLAREVADQLNATNHVAISWEPAPKAESYDLLRTDTPNFPQQSGPYAVVTGITQTFAQDQSNTLLQYNLEGLHFGAPVRCRITLNNRDYPQPTLELPCQLSVVTLLFADGSTQWTAGGGGAPILHAGDGISFVSVPGPPATITINSDVYSWQRTVNGNGHNLVNLANVDVTNSFSINGVPFAVAGSINLINIKEISGETGQPVTITSNTVVTGNVNLTGTTPQYQINGVPLNLNGVPAGTTGQIQFNGGGTPNVFAASTNLHWDITNSRLGIGTAAPGYPLTVAGDINITGTGPTAVYRVNGAPLAFDATQINLNPGVSTWTTVQNAISGINTTLLTLARGMAYVGTYDANGDVATFVSSVGIAPGPLPAPNATGLHPGDFIIVTTATTTGPHAPLNVGDQLVTDGTAWSRVAVGHSLASVTAATVPLSPVLGTWDTVQTALTALQTTHANAVLTTGSYADPAWITSLAWSKITGVPAGIIGPAGAVGQIQFNAGGTPNVFGASANLFWDSANGRLGIHEAAPAYDVDIDGDLNVTGSIFVDSVEFASPGSAHLHATSIGGLDGAPLQILGDVQFDGTTLQRLLDRLNFLEQKLGSL